MRGEPAELIAERLRSIAASMSDKDDAAEITRYANWLLSRRYDGETEQNPIVDTEVSSSE